MKTEWTSQRVQVMRRNSAIMGRNRFIEQFNEMFGERRPLLPLEPLPETGQRDRSTSQREQQQQCST